VLAVCSVRGLYHAFPPPDPPVYVWPQLKPSHGICSFTTTTFGAHRGADQGAGRSTSRRDLLHLLGGSTLASPLSTAGLLQPPGLTSTRPGRHTAVLDLHRHLRAGTRLPWAGIFMSRPTYLVSPPTYMGPGLTPTFPRLVYMFFGRIMRLWAGIWRFWPSLAGINSSWAGFGLSWPAMSGQQPGWADAPRPRLARLPLPRLGRSILIRVGRFLPQLGRPIPASPCFLRRAAPASPWASNTGLPWFPQAVGWAPAGLLSRRRCKPARLELPASRAALQRANPASSRFHLGCGGARCAGSCWASHRRSGRVPATAASPKSAKC
jgi:hypothetical protein